MLRLREPRKTEPDESKNAPVHREPRSDVPRKYAPSDEENGRGGPPHILPLPQPFQRRRATHGRGRTQPDYERNRAEPQDLRHEKLQRLVERSDKMLVQPDVNRQQGCYAERHQQGRPFLAIEEPERQHEAERQKQDHRIVAGKQRRAKRQSGEYWFDDASARMKGVFQHRERAQQQELGQHFGCRKLRLPDLRRNQRERDRRAEAPAAVEQARDPRVHEQNRARVENGVDQQRGTNSAEPPYQRHQRRVEVVELRRDAPVGNHPHAAERFDNAVEVTCQQIALLAVECGQVGLVKLERTGSRDHGRGVDVDAGIPAAENPLARRKRQEKREDRDGDGGEECPVGGVSFRLAAHEGDEHRDRHRGAGAKSKQWVEVREFRRQEGCPSGGDDAAEERETDPAKHLNDTLHAK